jgi:hypothetical protein
MGRRAARAPRLHGDPDVEEGATIIRTDRGAAALYFLYAGGNVVELIANDHLDNDSDAPFGPDSLLEIAEIGLATGDIETCCCFPRCRTASAASPTCKPPRGPQQAREVRHLRRTTAITGFARSSQRRNAATASAAGLISFGSS